MEQWGNIGSGGSSGSLPKSWWKLAASPAARRQGNNFANVGLSRLSNYSLVDSGGVRGGAAGVGRPRGTAAARLPADCATREDEQPGQYFY